MSDITVFGNQSYFNEDAKFFKDVYIGENMSIVSGNIILTSENGVKYKLVVSDSGVLSTIAL